ncbi:hypothetical protein [Ectothiorhodospira shaposhnikovii]|uniref:hypothetical protein n=1 Tax=Ectothiorhodospira shaposhnikovii TaxID=1054 RepID=UPI0039A121C6
MHNQGMSRPILAGTLAMALLATGTTAAADSRFGMAAKVGTTGLGLEGTVGLSERVNLRAGLYGFDYSKDFEEEGIDYDGDLKLRSAALLADWHPFGGNFRVSAGAYHNGNELKGKADGSLDIGDNTYDASLDATIDWRSFAPYVGIGYGNAIRGSRWSFAMDAGVMFTGSPDVRLRGQVSDPALEDAFNDDLKREEDSLKEELKDVKYWPVLSLGVSYRF